MLVIYIYVYLEISLQNRKYSKSHTPNYQNNTRDLQESEAPGIFVF